MAEAKSNDSIKLTTTVFRTSFVNVFKPRVNFEGKPPEYSLDALFNKKDKENGDMIWLKKAVKAVADAKWGAGKWPKNFKSPIKDGDEKELEGYAGNWVVTMKSRQKPGIVDKNLEEIINPEDFYSGCFAKATVQVKWYSNSGNNGVNVYLQNLQKKKDGEAFSGKKNAKDDFEAIEDLEDDSGDAGEQADEYNF